MKKSRFSEVQIVGILKEHEAGLIAKQVCVSYAFPPTRLL